jgi:hypothetical protein
VCANGVCNPIFNTPQTVKVIHGNIFRLWCGANQLDLVVKEASNKLCDERFLGILTGVTGHLCRQQNFITDMKSSCPTFCVNSMDFYGKSLEMAETEEIAAVGAFREQETCLYSSIGMVDYTASSTILSRISSDNVLWGALGSVQYIMYVERN